jgi:preprotein translocase subunit Sec61beta
MEKDKYSQPNAVVIASILIILLAAIAITLIVSGAITS